MENVFEKIGKIGIVPVIKIDDVEKAVPLAKALVAGGIPCAEITFRTAEGEEAIRRIAAEVPEVVLGAGTVITTDQVDRALAAGAKYMVTPGFNPKIVEYCIKKKVAVVPGCVIPSDMERAIEFGLDTVKFFPAEQAGGLDYIKAVSAPYVNMKFMPTGGISDNNLNKYLAFDKIVACGGSWMVKSDLVDSGDFDAITALCKKAVKGMLGFELAHIGINGTNPEEAVKTAKLFSTLLDIPVKEGESSVFAGEIIEVTKNPYFGKNGHIGIATNSVERAVHYLESRGFAFNYERLENNNGGMKAIYLKDELAGFAVHLVKK